MVRIERQDIVPLCPYCEKKVEKLIQVSRSWFAINRVLCCPHCKKIVGTSAGRG